MLRFFLLQFSYLHSVEQVKFFLLVKKLRTKIFSKIRLLEMWQNRRHRVKWQSKRKVCLVFPYTRRRFEACFACTGSCRLASCSKSLAINRTNLTLTSRSLAPNTNAWRNCLWARLLCHWGFFAPFNFQLNFQLLQLNSIRFTKIRPNKTQVDSNCLNSCLNVNESESNMKRKCIAREVRPGERERLENVHEHGKSNEVVVNLFASSH